MDLVLPFPPTPEHMSQHAAHLVEVAERVDGMTLDYTVASLGVVDEVLGRFHDAGDDPDQMAETLFGFGAYIGEVIVCAHDAVWVTVADDHPMGGGWPLVDVSGRALVNPIGKAFKRVANGTPDSIVYFYDALVTE